LGIGNEFNGDDAAGVLAARRLALECAANEQILVIETGVAPENSTGMLRRFKPDIVLMLDAAQMNAAPGEIAWVPWETIGGMSASSHSLPLSMLARYLKLDLGCEVYLLGIQPAQTEPNAPISQPVQAAVDEIVQTFTFLWSPSAC
jgi:hydrogenase maturation protease HycI